MCLCITCSNFADVLCGSSVIYLPLMTVYLTKPIYIYHIPVCFYASIHHHFQTNTSSSSKSFPLPSTPSTPSSSSHRQNDERWVNVDYKKLFRQSVCQVNIDSRQYLSLGCCRYVVYVYIPFYFVYEDMFRFSVCR